MYTEIIVSCKQLSPTYRYKYFNLELLTVNLKGFIIKLVLLKKRHVVYPQQAISHLLYFDLIVIRHMYDCYKSLIAQIMLTVHVQVH